METSVVKAVTQPAVAITKYENSGMNNGQCHYSYDTENGIIQDVPGEMETVYSAFSFILSGLK